MSPISSRNSVPPLACSKRPKRWVAAPVKEPFSWPNSSLSINSLGIAATFKAINGLCARGLCRCRARATSSLPEPEGPLMSTLTLEKDRRPIARKTSCIAGAWPMISVAGAICSSTTGSCSSLCAMALCTTATASSTSNGLGRYSNAPRSKLVTALCKSE